jgi:kumamolisin
MTAYDANPLSARDIKGQGQTVVFFEVDGFNPSDLSKFARAQHLPAFNVQVIGGNTGKGLETPMDLETVHEIAPAAKLVDVNLLETVAIVSPARSRDW